MPNIPSKRLSSFLRKAALRRTLIALASLLLLYAVAGYLILPAVIKSQAEKLFPEKLHRRASIGKVEVDPFALTLTVRDFKLMEPEGDAAFAAFETLSVNLAAESLLRLAPVVQQARLDKPTVHLVRQAAHRYNIDDLIALAAKQPPSPQPARFSLNNVRVEAGSIDFHDLPEKSVHRVTGLFLGIPFISSLPSQVDIFVEPLLQAQVDGSPLLLKGKARPFADPKEAVVELNLDGLDVTRFGEYLPFDPGVALRSARLDAHLTASFRQPKDAAPAVTLAGSASLKSLHITQRNGASLIKLPQLDVALGNTDLFSGRIALAKVLINGLDAEVLRSRDGQLNLQHVLSSPSPSSKSAPAAESTPLQVTLDELEIRNGAVRYADPQSASPLRAGLEKVGLTVRKLAVDTGKRTVDIGEIASGNASLFLQRARPAAQAAPQAEPPREASAAPERAAYAVSIGRLRIDNWSARFEDRRASEPIVTTAAPLSAAVDRFSTVSATPAQVALKANVNKSGRLALDGKLGMAPLRTDLAVEMDGVDILPLQPLVEDRINLRVTRASLSSKGRLQLDTGADGALHGGFRGDASLNNVATVDETNGNDFVRWKSLAAAGLDLRLAPFALAMEDLALNDFFARIIIDPNGRINLQDIARGETGERRSLTERAPAAPARGPAAAAPAGAGQLPPIGIRRLSFQGGRVRFTDNFIKPNYSASLTGLGGTVSGLSSDPSAVAGVDLHGEVNRAPLAIVGRIHPLRENLFLDVKATVRGMELADLSPYADRYIGYGIEKGKLSFEVSYLVEHRKLSASNRLILNQLTLSERSASSTATRLPVKLAIALLQDRDGVIDVNVPVEGSLDDPQFSVGGIVLKVIGNAILKAVSQPFALLGSIFHADGGAQLSHVNFDPGSAAVTPAMEGTLNTLAKALANRPGLQLDITGWSDRQADEEGLRRASVERKVRAMKRKDLLAHGQVVLPGSVTVSADEYPALLARVYKEENFDKPHNLIGLAKKLPVPEMEKLIAQHATIDEDDLNALANRRAQAVKDWFIKFGKIPGDRMFILAAKSGQPEGKEGALSKVEFSLK